jgi:hypothetical protein
VLAAMAYAFTGAVQFDPAAASVADAKLLAAAVQQYAQDNDEIFPSTSSGPAFRAAMSAYVKDPSLFVDPATGQYFVPNPAIGGKSYPSISNAHQTVLFQDAVALSDGKTTVAYVDGIVRHGGFADGDINQECIDRADEVAIGVMQYVQDHDELYPPMRNPQVFQSAVLPYVKDAQAFVCPSTNGAFVPNASLSFKSLASIAAPAQTVLFSDPAPHSDGIATIAYANGHVVHGSYSPDRLGGSTNVSASPCMANERRIGLALEQYLQDYDEQFPVFHNAVQLQQALTPYVGYSNALTCPENHQTYAVNTALSGVSFASLQNPAAAVVLGDVAVNNDGTLNTVYADGHVATVSLSVPARISVLPDNESRVLWRKADGTAQIWTLTASGAYAGSVALAADSTPIISMTSDSQSRTLLLRNAGNTSKLQILSSSGALTSTQVNGPYDSWSPVAVAIGGNLQPHLLWNRVGGQASDWNTTTAGVYVNDARLGPVLGAQPVALTVAPDNTQRLIFTRGDGHNQLWVLGVNGLVTKVTTIGTVQGGTLLGIAVESDGTSRILWSVGTNQGVIWTIDASGQRTSTVPLSFGSDWTPVGFGIGADGNYRVLCSGSAGALVDIVSSAGTVISANTFSRPQ